MVDTRRPRAVRRGITRISRVVLPAPLQPAMPMTFMMALYRSPQTNSASARPALGQPHQPDHRKETGQYDQQRRQGPVFEAAAGSELVEIGRERFGVQRPKQQG